MSRWKFALSSADDAPETAPILLRGVPEENLRRAARMGYEAIEVHMRSDAALNYSAIQQASKESGAKICALITGRLYTEGRCSLISNVPYEAEFAERGLMQYADAAGELQADIVIGWAKGPAIPPGSPEAALERLAERLRRIGLYAKERGVRVHLEVINRYEANFLNTAQEMLSFIETYQLDNCYVHLDTFHMNIEEADIVKAIAACGPRLGYIHVADNTRLYPGSGSLDFPAILRALEAAGYKGYVSVECLRGGEGEAAAERAIQYLRRISA